MKVFSPFLNGDTTTSGSFNVPNHPSTASIQNPLTGSLFHDDTDGVLKIYTGTQWQVVGEQTNPVPDTSQDIEYLLVAGGGAGGGGTYNSGGGGAGGLLSSSLASVQSGSSFTVTLGAGGTGAATQGNEGTNSTIAGATITTITSIGGGGGGSHSDNPYSGTDGGSGGGGTQGTGAGGSGTVGQGNNGTGLWYGTGGGGGGAGEAGTVGEGNVPPYTRGSQSDIDGGDGLQTNITGTSTYFAGGGGGGERAGLSVVRGNGGAGGGGQGGPDAGAGSAGTSNTGGGGGGSGGNNTSTRAGGSGGSGVAIFAYDSGSIGAGGGFTGDAGNGRKYHQFNISDTFVVGSVSDFQITTDSLYAHYDAGNIDSRGTSTWTDLKGSNNGTVTNSATLDNYHYTFNGSNQYIQISAELVTSDDMTIETWVTIDNPAETGTYREIYSQQANNNRGIYFGKTSTANQLRFGGSTYNFSSINASTFTHLVVTRNSSGDVIFYENGTQGGTATGHGFSTSQAIYNGTGTRFGRQYGNYTEYWDGKIAQVRTYSKVLSAAEVLQNYNATKTNFV